jgi:hypothetical protein
MLRLEFKVRLGLTLLKSLIYILGFLFLFTSSASATSIEIHSETQLSETNDTESKNAESSSKVELIPFMKKERHMSGEIIDGWNQFSKNIYRPEFFSLKSMVDLAAEQTFGNRYYYKISLIDAKFQYSTINTGEVGLFIESKITWLENSATCYIYSQYDDKTHGWLFNNYECKK